MEGIRMITKRKLGSKEKMAIFWWIVECVGSNRVNVVWVVVGPRVVSQ